MIADYILLGFVDAVKKNYFQVTEMFITLTQFF
jgi:hypothetical protein